MATGCITVLTSLPFAFAYPPISARRGLALFQAKKSLKPFNKAMANWQHAQRHIPEAAESKGGQRPSPRPMQAAGAAQSSRRCSRENAALQRKSRTATSLSWQQGRERAPARKAGLVPGKAASSGHTARAWLGGREGVLADHPRKPTDTRVATQERNSFFSRCANPLWRTPSPKARTASGLNRNQAKTDTFFLEGGV